MVGFTRTQSRRSCSTGPEDTPEVSLERFQRRRLAAKTKVTIRAHETEARLLGAEALVERPRRIAQQLVRIVHERSGHCRVTTYACTCGR